MGAHKDAILLKHALELKADNDGFQVVQATKYTKWRCSYAITAEDDQAVPDVVVGPGSLRVGMSVAELTQQDGSVRFPRKHGTCMIMDPVASGRVGGETNPLLHAAAPTDTKSDVVVLVQPVADITGELGWKISNAMAAWKEITINAVEAAEKEWF